MPVSGAVPFSDQRHEVIPVKGTVVQARPGNLPADLMSPGHYPVEATCEGCGQVVRSEHVHAGWTHTGRKPGEPS
jgi:hypothetical protein